ncbi:sensor histidine kinase [Streptomyces glomeratus]|uniref:Sensor-like histidine kinase SenX3 n=1 Tax=Streptomyces glomeratus TaxID=284452 RepID=A0ABP6LGY3_9ACTN|nr:sensor histidine kinase [Streptomyces glomeratus]
MGEIWEKVLVGFSQEQSPVPQEERRSRALGLARSLAAVCVTDEGTGFPPEFLSRAFDRLARAEASRTGEGSGLGLAFVQAVATVHGGTAHAEDTGRGACVVLVLPC